MEVTSEKLHEIASHFNFEGIVQTIRPFGHGHINDTFLCECHDADGHLHQYTLQNINTEVFREPEKVMENIVRVTEHLRGKLRETEGADPARETLAIIPSYQGDTCYRDGGCCWRSYSFIPGAVTHDVVTNNQQAYEAARTFARFQRLLADLPLPRLHETIPDFHSTPRRFQALQAAIVADPHNRASRCRPEINFALAREGITDRITSALADGSIPERITHNDTKINNILFDGAYGHAVCVIDLDTVMPGSSLYDFGDMVRTSTGEFEENTPDLETVFVLPDRFDALARGYLEEGGTFLSAAEIDLLAFSGCLITYEIGIRFLTDFLLGDRYFKTSHPRENLDRARTQFRFVESLEGQVDAMEAAVERYR